MISFKEFIFERVRTVEQAAKLGTYLTKRYDKKYPDAKLQYKRIGMKDDKTSFGAWQQYHQAASKSPDKLIFNKPYIKKKKVPIKNIRYAQDHVAFDANYATHAKGLERDKRPINLIKHKNKYFVIDGHHRLFNRKLLGHTHIDAKVFDPKGPK